jgi:hypothetical protein
LGCRAFSAATCFRDADGLVEQILAAVDVARDRGLAPCLATVGARSLHDLESARRRKGTPGYVMSGARSCMRRSNWYAFVGDGSKSYFS